LVGVKGQRHQRQRLDCRRRRRPNGDTAFLLTPVVLGDFDRNSRVDAADIEAMMSALADLDAYQSEWGLSYDELKLIADLDNVHAVTNADIQSLINLLAKGGGSGGGSLTAVPEPGAIHLALLGTGIVGLALRIRSRYCYY